MGTILVFFRVFSRKKPFQTEKTKIFSGMYLHLRNPLPSFEIAFFLRQKFIDINIYICYILYTIEVRNEKPPEQGRKATGPEKLGFWNSRAADSVKGICNSAFILAT